MTTRINQKHGIPRLPSGRHFTTSRGKFLDGTVWSYFAPGQPWTCQDGDFVNPTDWPRANTLLRVPQVVWLTPFFPNISSLAPSDVTSGFEDNPPYRDRDRTIQLGFGPDEYPLASHSDLVITTAGFDRTFTETVSWITTPNLDFEAQSRLDSVALEVKGRIEAIRPGQTWVLANNLHLPDYSGDDPAQVVGHYSHIAAPNRFANFFGIRFLHVHIGFPALGWKHFAGGGPTWDYSNDVTFPEPASDPFYPDSASLVRTAYPKFAGYATALYGYTRDWPAAPTLSNPDEQANATAAVDRANAQVEAAAAYLAATAADLEDFGFTYKGSDEPSADDLVALIADHFGFDPDTGLDL